MLGRGKRKYVPGFLLPAFHSSSQQSVTAAMVKHLGKTLLPSKPIFNKNMSIKNILRQTFLYLAIFFFLRPTDKEITMMLKT